MLRPRFNNTKTPSPQGQKTPNGKYLTTPRTTPGRTPPSGRPSPRFSNSKVKEEPVKIYHGSNERDDEWQPGFTAVVKLLMSVRIASALWGIINDCDEVYNYWEPLHMFLYGSGFQTWEYSPAYGIRSYVYIYLHYYPAAFFKYIFGDAKIAIFTLVRLSLGVFCLFGEYYAYLAVSKRLNISTGRFFIVFTCFSSGMFIASTAFLPSSFSMACGFYAMGALLNQNWTLAIICTAVSTLIGWPFAAVLSLPILLDMVVIQREFFQFIWKSLATGVFILYMMYNVDGNHFGKVVIAPYNIVKYNLFSKNGPTLYGEEPWHYFFVNLFLNWNIAFPLVFLAIPLTFVCFRMFSINDPNKGIVFGRGTIFEKRYASLSSIACGFFSWFIAMSASRHKEERFMFPAYPMMAVLAASAVDAVQRMSWVKREHIYCFMGLFVALSGSRSFSLYYNYGAHMEIYKTLHEELSMQSDISKFNDPIRVCVGKEWHRFPSSFFLPQVVVDDKVKEAGVELKFLESEFRGLLPKPFEKFARIQDVTRHIPSEMNDKNEEEPSRYVKLYTCDYVIDMDMPATEREPDFRTLKGQFKPVFHMPFLDRARSHWLTRILYIPFFSSEYNVYTNYTLYRKVIN